MNGVIAVLPQTGHYPLWQWLPERQLRLVTAADTGPVPVPHDAPDPHDRAASLSRILERWCEHKRPERIIHLDTADAQDMAFMRSRFEVPGQQAFSAAVHNNRLAQRERLQSAKVPVLSFAAIEHPAHLRAFADAHGLPVRVRGNWVHTRKPDVVLSDPAQLHAFTQGLRQDTSNAWIIEPAPDAGQLRIDALHRDGKTELVWIAETNLVEDALGRRRTILALDHSDPRAHQARDLLNMALSELPDPDIALVHATVHENPHGTLAIADLGLGIDPDYPRSLIRGALGVDPVRHYVQAAAGLPLPEAATRAARVTGRVEMLAGPGVLTALDPLPTNLAGNRTLLPDLGQQLHPGKSAARFEAAGPDRTEVTTALNRFATWFTHAAHLQQPAPTVAEV